MITYKYSIKLFIVGNYHLPPPPPEEPRDDPRIPLFLADCSAARRMSVTIRLISEV